MVPMLKGLLLAGAVGAVSLVALASSGRLDDLTAIRKPFNDVSAAISKPVEQTRVWETVTKKADAICAGYGRNGLFIRPTLPPHRAALVRAIEDTLASAQAAQAELVKLVAPTNYKVLYSEFLQDRQAVVADLKDLLRATKQNDGEEFALVASTLTHSRSVLDRVAEAARMPACAL